MQKLRELQSDIIMELTRSKMSVDRLTLRQKEGFLSVLPCGANMFKEQFERVLPASSVANLYPFNYSGKTDPKGFFIGRDKYGTNILVDFDRRADDKTNANCLILGNRVAFTKMIRDCKKGKIDRIITKSISRFARNTVDCLEYVRMLKELNIDVYFEEQGIHSIEPGAEFYITIYGSIAQSESENISANVRWGKEQAAKEGKVIFSYQSFLGYRQGADGQPEIVQEEAEIIKIIYDKFLKGDSLITIANYLTEQGILTPLKRNKWSSQTVRSILSNEKYAGDALLQKTYTVDFLTKKVKTNSGERAMYYVENNHPAIIDRNTFNKVQEELARRSGKRKVKFVGTKTQQGKYSSKYALTELLICGECGTPYRRCTWTARG